MRLLYGQFPDDFNIFNFGDVHVGTVSHYRNGFFQLADMINTEYDGIKPEHNFAIDHGDGIEAIAQDDPRYHADTVVGDPVEQVKEYTSLLRHFSSRLLFILDGNHPKKLWRFGRLTAQIAADLGVPFGSWTTKYSYLNKNGGLMFKQFATHGRKTINSTALDPHQRRASMQLALKRGLREKFGDCVVMSKGHTHKLIVVPPSPSLYLTDDGERIEQHYTDYPQDAPYIHPDHRWYINTGSCMRLYIEGVDTYAEEAEYDPLELGCVVVKVRHRKVVAAEPIIYR